MTQTLNIAEVEKAIAWMSRDVRNWFESDFDASLDYQCDAEPFCMKAVPDVCSIDDLTPLGAAIYRRLHPALGHE